MLNLQTKFGKKALQVGNWIVSLVSINFVWFICSVPALFMLVLLHSLPMGGLFIGSGLIFLLMLVALVLPATRGVFRAAQLWAHDEGSHYWQETLQGYLAGLKQWRQNVILAALIGLWFLAEMVGRHQVFSQSVLMVLGMALVAGVLLVMLADLGPQRLTQALQHPVKLVLATLLTIGLFLLNLALPLLFCIVLLSMSLSAWLTIKLMKF